MSVQATTPGEDLRHLMLGFRISQALYAAAALGVADLLAAGPQRADDLASASGRAPMRRNGGPPAGIGRRSTLLETIERTRY